MSRLKKQIATDGKWLYYDVTKNYRNFSKIAYLSPTDTPLAECTDDQRIAWIKKHNPEPEEVPAPEH